MKQSKISRIKELHHKVAHTRSAEVEDYFLEEKEISKLNDAILVLVCVKCFPLTGRDLSQVEVRPAFKYDIRYPKVKRIVEATVWNRVGK